MFVSKKTYRTKATKQLKENRIEHYIGGYKTTEQPRQGNTIN